MSESPCPPLSCYDNNNEANHKMRTEQRAGTATERGPPVGRERTCGRAHLNSLWSVWYGLFGTALMAYTSVKCMKRYLRYAVLSWPNIQAVWELQASLLLTLLAVLLLPFFLASAIFKVGNYANDGLKLGRCSALDPPPVGRSRCSLWRHGGPTAAFVHLVIAFSLLVPKLVMEARLIEAGYLPQDSIWRTDLDFMVVHHDRLVVLSFMTASSGPNGSSSSPPALPTAAPLESATATFVSTLNTSKGSPQALPGSVVNMLREFFNIESGDTNIDAGWGSSVSVEYLNYALALLVYSVRYPAVFWNTNKCFGIVFSLQLLVNSVQSLLSYAGMSVLYKVQIIGGWKALPLLQHYPNGISPLGGKSPFLLNAHVTLALFSLSSLLVLSSSLVLYLYGHGRFNSFLNHQRDRKHIFVNSNTQTSGGGWGYFTHCAALCCLLAVAVTTAPLLYDYTLVYRGSLDGAILACIIAGILHLFLWVVVWLFLTIKHRWTFKLRVTVGKATVRSARSVKLVTDIDLMGSKTEDTSQQPLLIVGNGRTYTVTEHSPKKAIMSVVQKATLDKKAKSTSSQAGSETTEDPDGEEQIYWLRPALVTPQRSPDSATGGKLCWLSGGRKKHKVTFNDATNSTSHQRNKVGGSKGKLRNGTIDEDDGDYATLRELPLAPVIQESGDDTTSEEGKLLACVHDDNVTYASTSRDLVPPVDYEDPSPLLTPEPLTDRETERLVQNTNTTAAGASNAAANVTVHNSQPAQAPRCLRRADSGMPHEELTPRSDSISTESSSSPPDPPGSNHSETSSGVHSNASSDHQNLPPPENQESNLNRRATSVADLIQPREDQWKSFSLQRNVQPPYPNQNFHHTKNHSIGGYNVTGQNGQNFIYNTKNNSLVNVSSSNVPNNQNYNYTQNSFGYTGQNTTYGYTSGSQTQTSTPQPLYGYTSSPKTQSSSPQPNYGYTNNPQVQFSTQPILGYTTSPQIQSSVPQPVLGYTTSPQVQSSAPQTVLGYTSSAQTQSSTPQPTYGYTTSSQIQNSAPQTYNYSSSPQIQTSTPQPTYGYTTSPQIQNSAPQTGYNYSSSPQTQTSILQPTYGYTSSPQTQTSTPQTVFNYTNTQVSSPQTLYGYTSSPKTTQNMSSHNQNVIHSQVSSPQTVTQPLYGYTTAQNQNTQPLYGYTSSPKVGQNGQGYSSSGTSSPQTQNQPIYGFTSNSSTGSNFSVEKAGGIPVILENQESTVVIRRKNTKSVVCDNIQTPVIKEEPFGRSTNMRMTSFTDLPPDLKNIQSSSATLPHYPTQPNQNAGQQYSTMPLPLQQKSNQSANLGAGTSCNVYSRQHSTIPTHHNGVRLFPANQNPYVKRYQNGVRVNGEGVFTGRKEENYFSS